MEMHSVTENYTFDINILLGCLADVDAFSLMDLGRVPNEVELSRSIKIAMIYI